MAIDTIKIQSPSVTIEVVEAVKSLSSSKNRIFMRAECGEIENVFTTSNLKGSYDANISIKTNHYKLSRKNGSSIKEPCEPYLTVECSVHKARIGHNVSGGSSDIIECVEWLVKYISTAIGSIELPPAQKWTVRQIDTAEMFQLASFDAVECWFKGLRLGDYYRKRPIHRYGGHGIQIGGHTTCLKFYHKGVEFRKHDRKRLAKIKIPLTKLEQIQSLADKTLRVEVSIKSQKLDYDFGHRPQVAETSTSVHHLST
ncbi:phage/plasmid replication protein, II/X family [Paenibacillus polymyxa]|uniref:phage/plasmid replication protein, II/X family n=1 Tax=Paenibacillus polymyxa TaxID=1406 RepID=UPI00287FD491|nr:phage/plasmid replication protein, II/X family [Paenibacillus polymyxa]